MGDHSPSLSPRPLFPLRHASTPFEDDPGGVAVANGEKRDEFGGMGGLAWRRERDVDGLWMFNIQKVCEKSK